MVAAVKTAWVSGADDIRVLLGDNTMVAATQHGRRRISFEFEMSVSPRHPVLLTSEPKV